MKVDHPSFAALDRYALGDRTASVRAHVASCERCRLHLQRLEDAGPLPAWVRQQEMPRRRWWPRLLGGFVLAGAAAGSLALLPQAETPAPYVAPKGMPSVALYVLRDGRTSLWNGTEALRPGDRVRLKVAPEGYGWVAVSAVARDGALGPLHRARIDPDGEYLLPESFRLDDAPGPERIHVALDASPTDPAAAAWSTTLEIPKETR